jgi:hypothetical protein
MQAGQFGAGEPGEEGEQAVFEDGLPDAGDSHQPGVGRNHRFLLGNVRLQRAGNAQGRSIHGTGVAGIFGLKEILACLSTVEAISNPGEEVCGKDLRKGGAQGLSSRAFLNSVIFPSCIFSKLCYFQISSQLEDVCMQ